MFTRTAPNLVLLTFCGLLFLLVLVWLCVAEVPPPTLSGSVTGADCFAVLGIPWWMPEVWGTLESRLSSIFTIRDLGVLSRSREALAIRPGFSKCLWVVLWGILVPVWQMVSALDLLQLMLTGGAGWTGLWAGQELGKCCELSLVLLMSLLPLLPSLLFLQCPTFVFTLGLSVKHGYFVWAVTASSHFTGVAASVRSGQPPFTDFENFFELFTLAERDFWRLCRQQLSWELSLLCWETAVLSVWWEESWGWDSPVESTTWTLECLKSWVNCCSLWDVFSGTSTALWLSLPEFGWLDLIQFPNCQSSWLTAGASACKHKFISKKDEHKDSVHVHIKVNGYRSFNWGASWGLRWLHSRVFTLRIWSRATLRFTGAHRLYPAGMCPFKWTSSKTHKHRINIQFFASSNTFGKYVPEKKKNWWENSIRAPF